MIFLQTVKLTCPAKQRSFQQRKECKWVIPSPKNNMDPEGKYNSVTSLGPHWYCNNNNNNNKGPNTESSRVKLRARGTSPIENGSCDMAWHDDKSTNRMDANPYIKWGFKASPISVSHLFQHDCHCLTCWVLYGEHHEKAVLRWYRQASYWEVHSRCNEKVSPVEISGRGKRRTLCLPSTLREGKKKGGGGNNDYPHCGEPERWLP